MEVAGQGREAERGCSEETGRLQTDIRCSSSIRHVSVRSGSRRAASILLFNREMCFWTIKLKAVGGIQIWAFTVNPSWLLDTWAVMVESLGFQQMPLNVILLVQVWEGGSRGSVLA